MAKRKKKGASLPDVLNPWPILVLAVDPGNSSGWAIFLRGQYVDSGELQVRDRHKVDEVVWVVIALANELGLKAALVLEHHPWLGHGRRTAAALEGSKQTWRDSWRAAGGPDRVVLAHLSTWRSRVLGRLKGDAIPRAESATAKAISGRPCGPDEAAAVCIGVWATKSGAVGKKLPKGMTQPPPGIPGGSVEVAAES